MKMNQSDTVQCPRMNSSDSDGCIILESEKPDINLVDTDHKDEEKDLLNGSSCSLKESILKIRFKDKATYAELSSTITSCVKNALFYMQKSVLFTLDPSNLTVSFDETSNTDDGLFIVDSVPSETQLTSDFVPEYSPCGVGISDNALEENKDVILTNSTKGAQNTCFNCDGDHAIKDCTKPKDINKIKQNRAKFSSNRLNYERYHVDVEQRFGHLVAGQITNDLRSALGLRSKELPEHIYRMRQIGYPPGWLMHAKVSHSGLSMFGAQGKEADVNDEDDEDKYDLNKILSFPGFNVEPPSGTLDKSRDYRAMSMYKPMDPRYSKSVMLQFLRSKSTKAYKRKSMKNTSGVDLTVLTPADMDIDDQSDNEEQKSPVEDVSAKLPVSIPEFLTANESSIDSEPPIPGAERQSPISDGEIVQNEPKRQASPSLDDLNERKKRLLEALDDSTVSISTLSKEPPIQSTLGLNSTVIEDSLIDDIMALNESSLDASRISEQNGDCSKFKNSSPSVSPCRPKTNLNKISESPSMHTSIETVYGTPVITNPIQGISPYSNLPLGANWAVGVTDVMDFENLPESVGKYDKMRTLIEKVRMEVKKIQYDDDDDDEDDE